MWEQLGNFASSGLGKGLIGAGLGYAGGKALGGDSKSGLMGAAAGGLLGGGFNMNDGLGYDFGDSALGSMFGNFGGQAKRPNGTVDMHGTSGTMGVDGSFNPTGAQAIRNAVTPQGSGGGLLGNIQDLYSDNKDWIGGGFDAVEGIGNYQTGRSQQKNYQANMDYINSARAREDSQYRRELAQQDNMSNQANTGFSNSSLYYT